MGEPVTIATVTARHERRQELLVALATHPALRDGRLEAALRVLTEAAATELAVARVSVWWLSAERLSLADLFAGAAHATGGELLATKYPSYFGALTKSRVLAADDARFDPRTREFRDDYLVPLGITSMLDAPVRSLGELVGVLCHEHVGPRRTFSIDEQMFAASLADLVGQALAASSRLRPCEHEATLADLSGEGSLGRFELLTLIGRGGMAEAFLAQDRTNQGFAVIKRLRSERATEATLRAMLVDEGSLALRMAHPNVVATREVADHKGATFLVMEYLRGQTVKAVSERCRDLGHAVPRDAWLVCVADALAGLHYAHELEDAGRRLEVVHRDVTPKNLFIEVVGGVARVKVLDFGVAQATVGVHDTETGMVKGTLAYMAPEQYQGDEVDRRVDIYAAGVVLWELLAGKRLRDSGSMRQLERSMASAAPLLPGREHADVEHVLARALAPSPHERYPTAAGMRLALLGFVGDERPARAALAELVELAFGTELARLDAITSDDGRPTVLT